MACFPGRGIALVLGQRPRISMASWVWLAMECWAAGLPGWGARHIVLAMNGVGGLDGAVPVRSQCVSGLLRGLRQTESENKDEDEDEHPLSTTAQCCASVEPRRLGLTPRSNDSGNYSVWPGLSYLTKLGAGHGATAVLHIASSCSHRSLVRKPAGCFDPGHGSFAVVGGVYPAMPPDRPLWETCIGQRHVPAAILGQTQLSALMKPPSALWRSAAPFRSPASMVSPSRVGKAERLWQLAALASLSSARGTPRRFTLQSSDDCVGISIFSLALRQRPKTGQPSSLGEMIELSTSNILSSGALKDEADLTDAFVLRALPVLCVFSLEAWVQPTPPTESRHLGTVRRLVNRGHALGLAYRRGPGGPKIR
ncbi:predicted protein [Chaetomium globosum CBS 148.51]|uniref:Uncharacterized protein n=1 Tax=Chaetomium globosum (strain ATCC 6205 / CBS 148.51 / DSM 1962 / NBRC 6347 / NRRL 1970) TaxID=306901 RepID=Q2H4W1_CHAGB|nr:uncharacterized protein CHGG_06304 [Chaetomium globosum CBS 148.51]EAQ89685.1 predicted protein [Chaetomium globosum CBS 148.51]